MSNIGQALPEAHSENPSGGSSPNNSSKGAHLSEIEFASSSSEHAYRLTPPAEPESQSKETKDDSNDPCCDVLDKEYPCGISSSQQPPNPPFTDSLQARDLNEKKEENKKCLDPRPTPFGKEKIDLDRTPTFSPDLSSNKGHLHPDQMFEDEGGGDGLASMESDEEVLPCYKTLQELLADAEGAKVFKSFLSENEQNALDFWCACNGLTNQTESERTSLVPLIFKTYIKNYKIKIDKQTRSLIKRRVEEEFDYDASVFDQAKLEVEDAMTEGAFVRFIKSEVYLNWLVHSKQGGYSDPSSPCEAQGGIVCGSSMLPTVPEGNECVSDSSQKSASLLTSGNLLATAKHRAIYDKYRSDSENRSYVSNPYYTGYASAINVSMQDSERQSMSSGARTDDNMSCTSGSLDGFNHRRLVRGSNQRILENARQNHESSLSSSLVKTTSLLYTKFAGKCPRPLAQTNQLEFASMLSQRLLDLQQEQDQQAKLQQSLQKIPKHKEDASHQLRREHAEISMPPRLLQQRLAAEAFQKEDHNQQILDDHVARVFDSPDHSPGSPKQKSPPSHIVKNPKFPHIHPLVLTNYSMKSSYNSKNTSKMGRHQPSITQIPPSSLGYYQDAMALPGSSSMGRETLAQPHFKNQSRNHSRRREKGQEIYSTFSTDSGNASEYTHHYPSLPKSKSMPEYIENHGGASDGGSSGSRPGSGNRRSLRHSCAETQEDSGISVVSDSIPSVGSSSLSADRISSWLAQSGEACYKGRSWTSHSVYPYVDNECRESQKAIGNRSTHTMAGSTSPGIQRRNGGSSGRRSQSSSSVSGSACTQYSAGSLPCQNPACHQHYEQLRESPTKYYSANYAYERRRTRGGASNTRLVKTSSHGDSSGSNGSTLKKQQKMKHYEGMSSALSGGLHSSSSGSPSPAIVGHLAGSQAAVALPPSEYVVAVYNYADDEVPFTTKIPSRVVTLKKFKQHLPKKGNYRFFFKKFCDDIGVVMAEVTEDAEVLPLFDGRIFAQIRLVED